MFVLGHPTQGRFRSRWGPGTWLGPGAAWTPRRARPARLWLPRARAALRARNRTRRSCLERSVVPGPRGEAATYTSWGSPRGEGLPFSGQKAAVCAHLLGPPEPVLATLRVAADPSPALVARSQRSPRIYELVTSGVSPRPTPTAVPWEAGRIWSGEARLIPSYFHLTEEKTKKKKPSGFASAVSLRGEGLAIVGGLGIRGGAWWNRQVHISFALAPTPPSSSSSLG